MVDRFRQIRVMIKTGMTSQAFGVIEEIRTESGSDMELWEYWCHLSAVIGVPKNAIDPSSLFAWQILHERAGQIVKNAKKREKKARQKKNK